VVDHGPAQPPHHPPPTTDRLSSHGRGLWLLACLVDEVRVERVKLGTRVTLRRRIRSPSRPTADGRQPSAGRAFS
jgi:anti-sigma regulatory factor (Ser/Thr protein kinase)